MENSIINKVFMFDNEEYITLKLLGVGHIVRCLNLNTDTTEDIDRLLVIKKIKSYEKDKCVMNKESDNFFEIVCKKYKKATEEEYNKKESELIKILKEKILENAENGEKSYNIHGYHEKIRIKRICKYFEDLGFTCELSPGTLGVKWA